MLIGTTEGRRRLLARMCLVREEIQNSAREVAFSGGRVAYQPATEATTAARGGVPRRAVAFLQVPHSAHSHTLTLSEVRIITE